MLYLGISTECGPLKHPKHPPNHPKSPSNHHQSSPNHIKTASQDILAHLPPLPYPRTLSGPRQPQPLFSPFRFQPAILSLRCCQTIYKNEIIDYIIALPFRGHDSIISLILIHAPRLNSIKCLVSLQYEQYGMVLAYGMWMFGDA